MSPDEQPSPQPSRRREWNGWMGKAVFEAGLIVLGLVGALLIDEWRETRERRTRIDAAMAAIEAELLENRKVLQERLASNERLQAELRALVEEFGPKAYYSGGIIRPGQAISDVAWEAARNAAITADVPFDRLVMLGRAYSALVDLRYEIASFNDALYNQPGFSEQFRVDPRLLVGRYNDMNRRIQMLLERLDDALATLRPGEAVPAPAAPDDHAPTPPPADSRDPRPAPTPAS